MGVFGWDEIQDGVQMDGVVKVLSEGVAEDGDWCFKVIPDQNYLLTNPDGYTNQNGLVECEIQPTEHLPGGNAGEDSTFQQYFGRLKNERVTVTGTWSRDRSHSVEGESLPGWVAGDLGKTEIHPITSIFREMKPLPTGVRRFEFMVFSDASGATILAPGKSVPHRQENRVGKFSVPVPGGVSYRILIEHDKARSKAFAIDSSDPDLPPTFHGTVETGRPGGILSPAEDKGFYYALLEVVPLDVALYKGGGAPHSIPAGQKGRVRITMYNDGGGTWTQQAGYRLRALAETWDVNRVDLPHLVAPGESVEFSFEVTAPNTPGVTREFPQWQMVHEGASFFGQKTPIQGVFIADPMERPLYVEGSYYETDLGPRFPGKIRFNCFVKVHFADGAREKVPNATVFVHGETFPANERFKYTGQAGDAPRRGVVRVPGHSNVAFDFTPNS